MAAGQAWRMPRRPSTMPTRISGTNSARSGVWRPTIAPRSSFGSSVMLGQRHDRDGDRAERDRRGVGHQRDRRGLDRLEAEAISMTAVIATGVPKPASASSSAPKQNAMITAWTRWSSETRSNDAPQDREVPGRPVML